MGYQNDFKQKELPKAFLDAFRVLVYGLTFLALPSLSAQTLTSYIEEAEANNPEVQAYELRYAIAKEKVSEVNSLPNTEFGAAVFLSEPETRTGAQKVRFSIKQMLPWFGTITARENYAASMAEVDYLDIAITKRNLTMSVSQSYYRLFGIKARQAVLDENNALLQTYEKLALTSVEVGNASAVDVLRLQMRQNELQEQKAILEREFLSEQTLFNKLLNRDNNTMVAVVDNLRLPALEDADEVQLALHPELLKYDRLYQSVAESESLNLKESKPDFGIGLDYTPVASRPNMDFADNGKDILMPMVSLSIPIFNHKYRSKSVQNDLRQQELIVQKTARMNTLETVLSAGINSREAARIKYGTQIKNLKQARDAEEILIKNYETGTIDFNDVLDIQELQLKFQMRQVEAVQAYYTQTAIINYLSNE